MSIHGKQNRGIAPTLIPVPSPLPGVGPVWMEMEGIKAYMHFFRHRRTAAFGGNTAGQSLWLIWYTCHKSFHINVLIILRLEIIKFIHKASLLTAYNEDLPHTQGKMEGRQKEVPPQPHKHRGAEKLRLRNPLSHTHLAFIKMNRNN